jgi:uncharacterized protein
MSKRPPTGLALALLLGASAAMWTAGAAGFSEEPLQESGLIDPSEIPSVHNAFYKVPEGTVGWDVLGNLDVSAESIAPLRTIFRVSYSPEIKALHGKDVKLMGFIYPLEGGLEHEHFLLTAWPPSCPFCLPAGPSQLVDVYAGEPIEFTDGAIMIAGRFEVLRGDPSGIYYRMRNAKEVERYDDIRWTGQLPREPQVPQQDEPARAPAP